MLIILGFGAYTDLKDQTVPDSFCIIATVSWWIYQILNGENIKNLMRGTAFAVLFYFALVAVILAIELIAKNAGFGGADLKLLAVIYLYSGFDKTLYTIVIAGIIALVVVLSEKFIKC